MKCFSCGKNFDYEKYYGICPKCGYYNKQMTPEEEHQQYHKIYDNGYQHPAHTQGADSFGSLSETSAQQTFVQAAQHKKESDRGGTKFLIISLVIFLVSFVGSVVFILYYSHQGEEELRQAFLSEEVPNEKHEPGEHFSFQGITLTVIEAKTLDWKEEQALPQGKKLVAVKLAGEKSRQDAEQWEYIRYISDAYIRSQELCYWQIGSYLFEEYTDAYGITLFDPYALSGAEETEGWLLFLLDESEEEFTLCLEERMDDEDMLLYKIHSIEISLGEDGADE